MMMMMIIMMMIIIIIIMSNPLHMRTRLTSHTSVVTTSL